MKMAHAIFYEDPSRGSGAGSRVVRALRAAMRRCVGGRARSSVWLESSVA
jgi:hypothetical protein